jgi:hypothetical protein
LLGQTKCVSNFDDTELFSVQTYQTHLGNTNFTVDAVSFFSGDVDNS